MKGSNRSGPPPDPNALRRDRPSDAAGWISLPAAGRRGVTPSWPLVPKPTKREAAVWREEWKRPQAVEWERLGLHREVAIHVRTLVRAEQPDAISSLLILVRQQQEALGLSVPGLARLRWKLDGTPPARRRTAAADTSVRDRLRAMDGGAT